MKFRLASTAVILLLAACQSTIPDVDRMDKYYREAEASVQRDVDRLHAQLASGAITKDEYDSRAELLRNSVGTRAGKLAWTRHELVEAQKRSMGIPTGDMAVRVEAPGAGGDSFYRRAGDSGGQGYSGRGAGTPRGMGAPMGGN